MRVNKPTALLTLLPLFFALLGYTVALRPLIQLMYGSYWTAISDMSVLIVSTVWLIVGCYLSSYNHATDITA